MPRACPYVLCPMVSVCPTQITPRAEPGPHATALPLPAMPPGTPCPAAAPAHTCFIPAAQPRALLVPRVKRFPRSCWENGMRLRKGKLATAVHCHAGCIVGVWWGPAWEFRSLRELWRQWAPTPHKWVVVLHGPAGLGTPQERHLQPPRLPWQLPRYCHKLPTSPFNWQDGREWASLSEHLFWGPEPWPGS